MDQSTARRMARQVNAADPACIAVATTVDHLAGRFETTHDWVVRTVDGRVFYELADWNAPEPETEPRKVLGWFIPRHIRAITGEGTITLQCEHGHAEGAPERSLDGPRFADPHVGAFLRAHAHGATIRSYRP
jgi:hypothetical protein